MTLPAVQTGLGASITCNDAGTGASTGAQTAFGYLKSFTNNEGAQQFQPWSYLGQGDFYIRPAPTMVDPGTMEFTCWYNFTDVGRLVAIKTSQAIHTWIITLQDTSTYSQSGYLESWQFGEVSIDQWVECKIKVKCFGAPTWTGV